MLFLTANEYSTANAGVAQIAQEIHKVKRPPGTSICAALLGVSDLLELVVAEEAGETVWQGRGARGRRSVAANADAEDIRSLLDPSRGLFLALVYARLAHAARLRAPVGDTPLLLRVARHLSQVSVEGVQAVVFTGLDTVDIVIVLRSDSLDDISEYVKTVRSVDAAGVLGDIFPGAPPALFRGTATLIGVPLDAQGSPVGRDQDPDRVVAKAGLLFTRFRFAPGRIRSARKMSKKLDEGSTLMRLFGHADALLLPEGGLVPRALTWGRVCATITRLSEQEAGVTSMSEVAVLAEFPTDRTPSQTQEQLSEARGTVAKRWADAWTDLRDSRLLPWSVYIGTPELLRQVAQLLEDDPEGFESVRYAVEALVGPADMPSKPRLYEQLREKVGALGRREHPYRPIAGGMPLEGVGYQRALDAFEHVLHTLVPEDNQRILVNDAPGGIHSNERVGGVAVLTVSSINVRHPFMWMASFHEASEATTTSDIRLFDPTHAPSEAYHDLQVLRSMGTDDDPRRQRRFWAVYGPALVTEMHKREVGREFAWQIIRRVFLVAAYATQTSPLASASAWGEVCACIEGVLSPWSRLAWLTVEVVRGLFDGAGVAIPPVDPFRYCLVADQHDRLMDAMGTETELRPLPKQYLDYLDAHFVPEPPLHWLPFAREASATTAPLFLYPRGGIGFKGDAGRVYHRATAELIEALAEAERGQRAASLLRLLELGG